MVYVDINIAHSLDKIIFVILHNNGQIVPIINKLLCNRFNPESRFFSK